MRRHFAVRAAGPGPAPLNAPAPERARAAPGRRPRVRSATFALGLAGLVACSGSVGPAGESDLAPADAPAGPAPGAKPSGPSGAVPPAGAPSEPTAPEALAPARVRRLTSAEIKSSIRDVFLAGAPFDESFPQESARHSFDNQYDELGISAELTQSLQIAAERAAALATGDLRKLLPCDPAAVGEEKCAGQFVDAYGLRAFRRPLTPDERERLLGIYRATRKTAPYATAIATVIEALIQSPHFLFRTELGAGGGGRVALDRYETASALSYFLWRSAPDDALLAAARDGKLESRADLQTQARRMLQDPRAKEAMRAFFLQWLELTAPESLSKADPAFSPRLAQSMTEESVRFIDDVLWTRDGSLATLLTSPATFVNADLAKLYGVEPPAGGGFGKATLDGKRRAGFLTHAAFLASHTPGGGFSPIFLGRFVRTSLFCQELPSPPADVPQISNDPNLSTRQRFAQHAAAPSCRACHHLMDPIGWGFEQFDPLGRHRPTEKNVPLTGEGELAGTDVDGAFAGPVQLATRLAQSADVRRCFSAHALKFALGRETASPKYRLPSDERAIAELAEALRKGGMKELLATLVSTDTFTLRNASQLGTGDSK